MIRLIALLTALALAGCAGDPATQYVYVAPDLPKAVPPSECTGRDPTFPRLPDGDVDATTAVRDRLAIRKRDMEIARRRLVCRKWLEQQFGTEARVAAGPAKN